MTLNNVSIVPSSVAFPLIGLVAGSEVVTTLEISDNATVEIDGLQLDPIAGAIELVLLSIAICKGIIRVEETANVTFSNSLFSPSAVSAVLVAPLAESNMHWIIEDNAHVAYHNITFDASASALGMGAYAKEINEIHVSDQAQLIGDELMGSPDIKVQGNSEVIIDDSIIRDLTFVPNSIGELTNCNIASLQGAGKIVSVQNSQIETLGFGYLSNGDVTIGPGIEMQGDSIQSTLILENTSYQIEGPPSVGIIGPANVQIDDAILWGIFANHNVTIEMQESIIIGTIELTENCILSPESRII